MPDPMAEHDTDAVQEVDLLAAEFSELARTLQAQSSVQATLDTICRLILEVVPAADDAGITIVKAGRFRTIASTSNLPRRIDALQYATGQGPCVNAITEHEVFRTGDLAEEDRWPDFAARAEAEIGVHSMLSVRLFLQQHTLGALNLYATSQDAFSDADRLISIAFAAHAAVAMQAAEDHALITHLRSALDSGRRIGVALGILMNRDRITEQAAFQELVTSSQHSNRKLRDIADQLVYTGEIPT